MSDASDDPTLHRIKKWIGLYTGPVRMSAAEMVHGVILELAYKERFDLVDQVVDALPESALPALREIVQKILAPEANWTPLVFGRVTDEWRQRMIPVCKQLGSLFQERLNRTEF
jgi:hypothetical protein